MLSDEDKVSLERMKARCGQQRQNMSLGEDEIETGQALSDLYHMMEVLIDLQLEGSGRTAPEEQED